MIPTSRRVASALLGQAGRGGRLPVRSVLRLHQTIGNREVRRLLQPPPADPAPARPPVWRPVAWVATAWRRFGART